MKTNKIKYYWEYLQLKKYGEDKLNEMREKCGGREASLEKLVDEMTKGLGVINVKTEQ